MCFKHMQVVGCARLLAAMRGAAVLGLLGLFIGVVTCLPAQDHQRREEQIAELHAAAIRGDLDTATRLIAQGIPVDTRESGSCVTPLMQAARYGRVAVVRALLARGADLRAWTRGRGTALSNAASGGEAAVVRILIEHGAEPDLGTPDGYTPLMEAACRGNFEAVQLLLAAGAYVNAQSDCGHTALIAAACGGDERIVRRLASAGADLHARDHDGISAIDAAEENGDEALARLVRELQGIPQLVGRSSAD